VNPIAIGLADESEGRRSGWLRRTENPPRRSTRRFGERGAPIRERSPPGRRRDPEALRSRRSQPRTPSASSRAVVPCLARRYSEILRVVRMEGAGPASRASTAWMAARSTTLSPGETSVLDRRHRRYTYAVQFPAPLRIPTVIAPLFAMIALSAACNRSPCPPVSPLRTPLPPTKPPEVAPDGHEEICQTKPDLPTCRRPGDPLAPRCLPSDPACGPQFIDRYGPRLYLPHWRGPHGETGAMCFRPEAPRYPEPARGWSHHIVDACTNDGECRAIYCNAICASYRRPDWGCMQSQVMQEGPPPPEPEDAAAPSLTWCGCVAGRCTMFTQ
jgi:hypothetical protein